MFATLAFLVLAQVPQEWEKMLLPVVTRGPVNGALGSQWETVVTVHNGSDKTISFYPPHCALFPPGMKFCYLPTELAPGKTRQVDLAATGGVVLNVKPLDAAKQVFVQLRVRDITREATSFGTEIPVIPLDAMKTTRGSILDIPHDARFRSMFRLYVLWPSGLAASTVIVRFVNEQTGAAREEVFVVGSVPGVPWDEPVAQPLQWLQIADFDVWPEMKGAPRIRIDLEPGQFGARYWAFVSVTNNETQQVTTLSVH